MEGSQRFLPVVPNRHILNRFSNWIELNNATYRPRQAVVLILLNDALLVAVEKRRQMGGTARLVADKCFNLNEIAVTDLKDAGDLTNAVRIKRDREVHILRTEKPEDKRALLSAFKRILEETMSRRRKESVWEAENRRETVHGGMGRRGGVGNAPSDDSSSRHPLAGFKPSLIFPFITSDDPSGKDLSWIDDISDQLAVRIALREFEEAVALLEKAKSISPKVEVDPLAIGLLRNKIEQRSNELCSVLLASLADTGIRKTGVVKISGWLLRLGQGERARETFLSGRGELLKKRTSDIRFVSQGDGSTITKAAQEASLINEIAELAFVCFTLIRNTCEWYMAAYKDHQTASAFVRWASTQVEVFADIFKRQVYGNGPFEATVIQSCVDTATNQAAMVRDCPPSEGSRVDH